MISQESLVLITQNSCKMMRRKWTDGQRGERVESGGGGGDGEGLQEGSTDRYFANYHG